MASRFPILPPPGLYADDTKFKNPNRCVAADGVRWDRGSPQPVGGWSKYFGDQLSGICRNVLAWADLAGSINIALGTSTKLYVWLNGALVDITPSGLAAGAENGAGGPGWGAGTWGEGTWGGASITDYFPRTWSLDNWGENLMASPRMGGLYIWDNNTSNDATAISTAPDNISAMLVTAERQVLCLGCNEEVSTNFNPLAIRGSDIEDNTNFTTTATNNAFEHILEGGGSRIVTGKRFGSYVAVWTDKGVHLGQFLGNPDQTYRFDAVAANCGLIGPNAVEIVNQTAYWITPDYQFYAWQLGGVPVLLPCPIRDQFKDAVSTGQYEKIAATTIGQYGEVWWFYPHKDDGLECSRAVFVNVTPLANGQAPIWSEMILARSACVDSAPTAHPIFVSPDGYVYSHEDGQTADGGTLSASFTIELPTLDEGGRFALIKGIEPDLKDQVGAVSVSFSLRKYAQGTAREYGPYALAPNAIRKHFMLQGRSGEITFSWNSSPAAGRMGKPVLIIEPTGAE